MVSQKGGGRGAPAAFDDALFEADLLRVGGGGRAALRLARRRIEREGLTADREGLTADQRWDCHAEHPGGTELPGCKKTYVPGPGGRWRMVFQVARIADGRLGLVFVAAGVGHVPGGLRRDVYDLAHYRLHGRWPARRST